VSARCVTRSDAKRSLVDAKRSLVDAKRSLVDAKTRAGVTRRCTCVTRCWSSWRHNCEAPVRSLPSTRPPGEVLPRPVFPNGGIRGAEG
jgi:hypothetical protein